MPSHPRLPPVLAASLVLGALLLLGRTLYAGEPPAETTWERVFAEAEALEASSSYEEAAVFYRKALPLAEARGDEGALARTLLGLGSALDDAGRSKEGLPFLHRAVEAYEALDDAAALVRALRYRGVAHENLEEDEKALADYERAASLGLREELPVHASRALQNLSSIQGEVGQLEASLEAARRSLRLARDADDAQETCDALHYLGLALERSDRADEAIHAYTESIARGIELEDIRVSWTVRNLGRLARRTGKPRDALAPAVEAGRFLERRPNEGDVGYHLARVLIEIGLLFEQLHDYRQAAMVYEGLARIRAEQGEDAYRAWALRRLGSALLATNRGAEGRRVFSEEARLREELGDEEGLAAALDNVALGHQLMGNYPAALELHQQALERKRRRDDPVGHAQTLVNIAGVYLEVGVYDRAEAHYEEARALFEEAGYRRGLAKAWGGLGDVHSRRGDGERAVEAWVTAHEIFEAIEDVPGLSKTWMSIGLLHLHGNHLGEAGTAFQHAYEALRAMGDDIGAAHALQNLGSCQAQMGNGAAAEATLKRALALLGEEPNPAPRSRILASLARVAHEAGRHDDAIRLAKTAATEASKLAEGLSEDEGASGRSLVERFARIGVQASLETNRVADAVDFLELGRAGTMRESLRALAMLSDEQVAAGLRDERDGAQRRYEDAVAAVRQAMRAGRLGAIRQARSALTRAGEAYEEAAARLQRTVKLHAEVAHLEADSLAAIQASLRPEEALLLYGQGEPQPVVAVIRRESARLVRIAPDPDDWVAARDSWLEDADRPWRAEAEALRRVLAEPLALEASVRRVLVSPSGWLAEVPFALAFPEREVVLVPSGTVLGTLLPEGERRGLGVLGIGDPHYGRHEAASPYRTGALTRLAPLPSTRSEVEAVATTRLLGERATETALWEAVGRRARWRAVHFACHGLIDPKRPLLSALALTPDGESDGFLTCHDVLEHRLPADLVVLSACETARGRIYSGEGVVGFTRAFLFAGTPRVLCSLWKVDDEATRALMTHFYERWHPQAKPGDPEPVEGSQAKSGDPEPVEGSQAKSGDPEPVEGSEDAGLSTAAALRAAQAHVRAQPGWEHPAYWAAWVLWGLGD